MLPRVRLVARAVHGPHRGALLRGWAVQPAQLASLPRRELFLGASSLQRYLQQLQLDGSCRRLSTGCPFLGLCQPGQKKDIAVGMQG